MGVEVYLKHFGCSKLGSGSTYATPHLLFELTGNPLHRGLMMVEFDHIDTTCPIDVEAHPVFLNVLNRINLFWG